jgi:hypothetical protein
MFGFGKFKFAESTSEDYGYLKGFLINQPLPSYLGWYAQKLPLGMLKGALALMFLAEIPIPLLLFVPGRASTVAAVAIASLMVAIQLCGSFGYFSLAMRFALKPHPRRRARPPASMPTSRRRLRQPRAWFTARGGARPLFNSWVHRSVSLDLLAARSTPLAHSLLCFTMPSIPSAASIATACFRRGRARG